MRRQTHLLASVALILAAGCGGLGHAEETTPPAATEAPLATKGRIPPLTETQARAVQPVLESLAEWIARMGSGCPELDDFHPERVLFRAPEGLGLMYSHDLVTPPETRPLRAEDFGPNGLFIRFTCAPMPTPGEPPYAMAPPTRSLPNLRLYLWTDVQAGPRPTPGLIERLRAVINAHVEMLLQADRAAGGSGAAPPEDEIALALRALLEAKDPAARLARRMDLLAHAPSAYRTAREGLLGKGPLSPEEAVLVIAMLGGADTLRAALDETLPNGAHSGAGLRLLVGALAVPDPEACGPIVDLIRAAAEDALPALAEGISSPKIATRDWATDLLSRIGPPAIPALAAVLRQGPALGHFHAVRALRTIGDPRCVPVLIEALRDPDPYARLEAANALEEIGDGRARGPLLEALNDPENAHTAALFGIASAVGAFRIEEAFDRLSELAGSPNWLVRRAVLVPLAQVGGARALPVLLALLEDPRAETRAAAATALGVLRRPDAVPDLLSALEDPSPEVAARAAWALGEIGDARASEALDRLVTAPDPALARAAADALARIQQ